MKYNMTHTTRLPCMLYDEMHSRVSVHFSEAPIISVWHFPVSELSNETHITVSLKTSNSKLGLHYNWIVQRKNMSLMGIWDFLLKSRVWIIHREDSYLRVFLNVFECWKGTIHSRCQFMMHAAYKHDIDCVNEISPCISKSIPFSQWVSIPNI